MPDELDTTIKSSSEALAGLPGRYENRGIIAQGGMGIVFHAHDLQLFRDVAIKVLQFDGSKDAILQERFMREAKTLAALDHPNIVKLLTWGLNKSGNLYLVMEFLDGLPLSNEIGNGRRLTPTRFHEIFKQVLSGLEYAHSQGVVHRDCKPSNIILCQDVEGIRAKLIDFGIARLAEQAEGAAQLTQTGLVLGSPNYMSPEQCKGHRVDSRSDIYSIACVMHEALSGQPPHLGDTVMDVMYKHATVEAASLESLAENSNSRRLGKLIDSCLAKDPLQRPASAGVVLAELNEIFKERIDTGKLFAKEKGKSSQNKPLTIIVTLLVLLATIMSVSLISSKTNPANSAKVPAAEKHEEEARARQQLERSVLKCKQFLNSSHNTKEEKNASAERLVDSLMKTADLQREAKDFKSSEETLRTALPFCSSCKYSNQATATLMKDLAYCMMGEEDYKAAATMIDDALRLKYDSSDTRSQLYFAQAELNVREGDFTRATEAFDLSLPYVKRYVAEHKVRDNPYSRLSTGMRYENLLLVRAKLLWKRFQGLRPDKLSPGQSERLSAIAFLNKLAQVCLDENSDDCSEALEKARMLVQNMDKKTAGLNQVAAETYSLSSLEDELKNNKAKAEEDKKLSEFYRTSK